MSPQETHRGFMGFTGWFLLGSVVAGNVAEGPLADLAPLDDERADPLIDLEAVHLQWSCIHRVFPDVGGAAVRLEDGAQAAPLEEAGGVPLQTEQCGVTHTALNDYFREDTEVHLVVEDEGFDARHGSWGIAAGFTTRRALRVALGRNSCVAGLIDTNPARMGERAGRAYMTDSITSTSGRGG